MMTRDQTRTLLTAHQNALNRHDAAAATAFYADDAVVLSPMFEVRRGRTEIADSFERLFTIFPDYQVQMKDALFIAEGDRAAEFSTVTGTHSVELFGLPPTGHQVQYQVARLFTFRDELIVYEQRIYDFRGLLDRLEKARLDRELTLAAALQRTLLSETRQSGPFFEAAAASTPSRAIGGDFFEYIRAADGGFGVALGDVSGKGPAAALMAAMLQGMFSVEARADHAPSDTLSRLNKLLHGRGLEPRFATLVYGVLSPEGQFRYTNAGHHPPLLVTRSRILRLTTGGPMLGVFRGAQFPEETVTLQPGDTLVTYSDGVTEALGPSEDEFGIERLTEAAAHTRSWELMAILDHMFAVLRDFCGGQPQADDMTIMVTRFR